MAEIITFMKNGKPWLPAIGSDCAKLAYRRYDTDFIYPGKRQVFFDCVDILYQRPDGQHVMRVTTASGHPTEGDHEYPLTVRGVKKWFKECPFQIECLPQSQH